MDEMIEQNFRVIEGSRDSGVNEVFEKLQSSRQTNPIVRKLLDFSSSDKTRKFSIIDLLKR